MNKKGDRKVAFFSLEFGVWRVESGVEGRGDAPIRKVWSLEGGVKGRGDAPIVLIMN